ncbi:MAG: heavy-metal-associated domain-containing protein [Kiritimatiellia bacterium]
MNAITSAVQQLPGVDTCTVSLEEASATVVYRPGTLTPEQIQKRINQLGFQASLPEEASGL